MRRRRVLGMLALALACCRSRAETEVSGDAARAAPANANASTAAPSAAVPGPTQANPTMQWRGSYKSASGELYIPPDWKSVRWSVKETAAGLGEGNMTLSVERASGRALGSLDGPLGPAVIDGLVADGKLTATIARKDPGDKGFSGTLTGSIGRERAEGTMNVSLAEASAVRKATFALSPDVIPH